MVDSKSVETWLSAAISTSTALELQGLPDKLFGVQTFAEAGISNPISGLVLRFKDGSSIYLTISQDEPSQGTTGEAADYIGTVCPKCGLPFKPGEAVYHPDELYPEIVIHRVCPEEDTAQLNS